MNDHGSPELTAVCALISPHHRLAVWSADSDPTLIRRIAVRHQVGALVEARLTERGWPLSPALTAHARRSRELALRQIAAALAIRDAMTQAGVDLLFLKGLALSQRAFGSVLARFSIDIDLLVAPPQADLAWEVLDRLGYRRLNPHGTLGIARLRLFRWVSKDSLHRHDRTGVTVELHWRMSDENAAGLPPPADRQLVEVTPGERLTTLADEPLFTYLAAHGAAHAWARLKWLADVAALLAAAPGRGEALWDHARRSGHHIAAASAIIMSRDLMGLDPPANFKAPRSLRLAALNCLALLTLGSGGGTRDLAASVGRGWTETAAKFLVAPGLAGVGAALRRLALSGEDIAQIALPPALFWLYPVLRIPLLIRRRLARARGRG